MFSPHDIEILKAEMEKRQPSSSTVSEEKAAIEDKVEEEKKAVSTTDKTDSDTAVAASS